MDISGFSLKKKIKLTKKTGGSYPSEWYTHQLKMEKRVADWQRKHKPKPFFP